jgi:hypothetical protein
VVAGIANGYLGIGLAARNMEPNERRKYRSRKRTR